MYFPNSHVNNFYVKRMRLEEREKRKWPEKVRKSSSHINAADVTAAILDAAAVTV